MDSINRFINESSNRRTRALERPVSNRVFSISNALSADWRRIDGRISPTGKKWSCKL
jgi:hypothetical protein